MSTRSNVIAFPEPNVIRQARGAFVKGLLDDDGRSARYVSGQVGISNSAMSDRLKGKAPFLADELEGIARVLKIDPVDFYREYISVGIDGPEAPVSEVKSRHFTGELIDIFTGRQIEAVA